MKNIYAYMKKHNEEAYRSIRACGFMLIYFGIFTNMGSQYSKVGLNMLFKL